MQGTKGQDQVPAADSESTSQQLATGSLLDGERLSQSVIFGSEAADPQAQHDDDKERDHEPEVLLPTSYRRMPLKVLLVRAWATHTGTQRLFSKFVSTGPHC
jgi:hypothetical protein